MAKRYFCSVKYMEERDVSCSLFSHPGQISRVFLSKTICSRTGLWFPYSGRSQRNPCRSFTYRYRFLRVLYHYIKHSNTATLVVSSTL
ncbi:hypothetical protein GDO81_008198 [Engystomops pustulosus]|uniref:Uncharacterized protein n=1 Tax=Engystomops pustulosus TaxID=76066 RepID=A0AAV7CEH9_ENGPU|nr:hypothetical protein GDO81_008198 [Engystomops pustulosus]